MRELLRTNDPVLISAVEALLAGADISCITDIRFSGPRAYVSVMDEGTFMTDNGGQAWHQLWPHKYLPEFIGHN